MISQANQFQELYETIKSEIDYDTHCAVGLGKRMPVPDLSFEQANLIKQQVYKQVAQIYQHNVSD